LTIGQQAEVGLATVIFGLAPRRRAAPACSCGRGQRQLGQLPAKQEPGSISANRLREDTSRRLKVRRSRPMVSRTSQWSVGAQHGVHGQHGGGIALGLESQVPMSSSLVRMQDGVVQLARHGQRPPGGAGGLDAGHVGGLRASAP
jgi:hypothetical protein